MALLNLAYTQLIRGGTIIAGTTPDGLSLGANIGRLKQVFYGQSDTFRIDPVYGMYKTNADNIEACYRLEKITSWFNLAKSLNTDATTDFFSSYIETKLSLGNAQPFKLTIGIFSGQEFVDINKSVRLIIECITTGSIQYHFEYYHNDMLDTIQKTPVRTFDLTFLGAPFLFNTRIYVTPFGLGFEVTDEYNYYSDTPLISYFHSIDKFNANVSGNQPFFIWHSRTALDYPSIASIGWGYILPVVENRELQESDYINGEYLSTGLFFSPGDSFKAYRLPRPEKIENVNGFLIPEKIIFASGGNNIHALVYPSGFANPVKAISIGGEVGKNIVEVNYNSSFTVYTPPGSYTRYLIKYKVVER